MRRMSICEQTRAIFQVASPGPGNGSELMLCMSMGGACSRLSSSWSLITYTLPLKIVLRLGALGVTGNVSRLGMLEVTGLVGDLGLSGLDPVTCWTFTSLGICRSSWRFLGSRIPCCFVDACLTNLPFASNPTISGFSGMHSVVSSGSSGMHSLCFSAGLTCVVDGLGMCLADPGL